MRKEAVSFLDSSDTANAYHYKVVHSTQDIAAAMQRATEITSERLALVTICMQFGSQGKVSRSGVTITNRSIRHFLENLRPLVRKTDLVFLLDQSYYFALHGANEEGGRIVQQRLWEALLWRIHSNTEPEILSPQCITIGHSAYPIPCNTIDACIVATNTVRDSFEVSAEKSTHKRLARQAQDEELPALSRKLGVPYLTLLPRTLPARVHQLISPQLAQELHCYPLGCARNTLTVAMSDPQDSRALNRLRQETGLHIFPILVPPEELETALEQLV